MFSPLSAWYSCFSSNDEWWWNQTIPKIFSDPGISWIYNIIICYPMIQSICDKKWIDRKWYENVSSSSGFRNRQYCSSIAVWFTGWIGSLAACLIGWLVSGAAWTKSTKCKCRMQWNRLAKNSWNFVRRVNLRLTISINWREKKTWQCQFVSFFSSQKRNEHSAIPQYLFY